MTDQPPPPPGGNYPPPPPGGNYPPPPPGGNYPPPPGGNYPPPPGGGGYPPPPPPPGGGYPPPPPPGGGYPPPPPPPGGGYPPPPLGGQGYGPPQGGYQGGYPQGGGYGQPPFSVGDAFSWAWNKFSKNAVPLIVATLALAVILGVLIGIVYGLVFALAPDQVTSYEDYDSGFSYSFTSGLGAASIIVGIIGWLVVIVVSGALTSGYFAGVLDIANGQQVSIGSFFKPRNVGSVVIATVIVGIITSIGSALCYVPGLIASIFLFFTTVAIVDRGLTPVDGIKQSFNLAKDNFVSVLLVWLVSVLIIFVGSLICGVGLLVAAPVAALLVVYAYRSLTGGQVAPATQ